MALRRWIGILGSDLGQSRSKEIHEEKLKRYRLSYEFRVLDWFSEPFETNIFSIKKDSSCIGFSVTMPFKQKVVSYVDRLDVSSESTGVVNCVKNLDGYWAGYNTDGVGFLRCLKQWNPMPPKDIQIVFLGTGATARSLSFSLAKEGYRHFLFMNRTLEKGMEWGRIFQQLFPHCDVMIKRWGEEIPRSHIFLLNTTSFETPIQAFDWLDMSKISHPIWMLDVNYHPSPTWFIQHSRALCFYTMDGWPMLQEQAELAFRIWMDQ